MYRPSPLKEYPTIVINGQVQDFATIDREFKASLCRMLDKGMSKYLLDFPGFTDPKSVLDKSKVQLKYGLMRLRFQKLYNSNFMTKTDTPPYI
jgi:hypothetical protein